MKAQKDQIKKEKYNRSKNRSSTRKKGKVHSETTTFNHPRKDTHSPS